MSRYAIIVSPNPASSVGGVERMCVLLAKVLVDRGWTVDIVGVEKEPGRWQFRFGVNYLLRSRNATKVARGRKPDLLITNGLLGLGWSRNAPRVHVYHGTMVGNTRSYRDTLPRREQIRRTLGAGMTEALAGRGATVVCVAEAVAEEVRCLYRVNANAVIPNGIDTSVFTPRPRAQARARLGLPADGRYALYVGRLEQGKGADLLAPASRRAGFELLIAGSSGMPSARHLGVLAPQTLADAYCAADCVLFPSRYEACSYVVLESLACEVPLITTRVGWMRTLLSAIPSYDALCVSPNVDDISGTLSSLNHRDTTKLCSSARSFVLEHNSLERYAEEWHGILRELSLD